MEMKRSEKIRLMKQDRKKDTPSERYARIQINKDLRSRKRDKGVLIVLTLVGLMIALLAPKELSRTVGIILMFMTSLMSILV